MAAFVKHSLDCSVVNAWAEVSHWSSLEPPEEGFLWTEVPTPVRDWTVTLVDGVPTPAPLTRSPSIALALRKKELRALVKAKRDEVEWNGCATPYGRVDTDPDSQRKLTGGATAALVGGPDFSVVWRMADNSEVSLNAAQMMEVGMLAMAHVSACQHRKNELDALIAAAATMAELDAIDIEAGWPG